MSTVITLNTYLQSLPSHHQCRGYIHTYMCVHDSETDDCGTVWGGNIHKIMTTLAGGFLVTYYHDAERKVSKSNLDQGRKQRRPLRQTAVDAWHGWSLKFSFCVFLSDKTIEKSIPFSSWERPKNQKRPPKLIMCVLNWIGRKQRNRCLSTSVVRMQANQLPKILQSCNDHIHGG